MVKKIFLPHPKLHNKCIFEFRLNIFKSWLFPNSIGKEFSWAGPAIIIVFFEYEDLVRGIHKLFCIGNLVLYNIIIYKVWTNAFPCDTNKFENE